MAPRQLIALPGEALVGVRPPTDMNQRLADFMEFSGLETGDIIFSHYATVPMPRYPAAWPEGRKRWTGIKPEAMWHPLFWLPDRVASKYVFTDEGGNEQLESDDEWAARVALELTASGLYDQQTGEWQDILGIEGIDTEDENDKARISAWLSGNEDELLDSIDLSEDMNVPDDPNWAADAIYASFEDLRVQVWAIVADDAYDSLSNISDEGDTEDDAEAIFNHTVSWSEICILNFEEMPDEEMYRDKWEARINAWDGTLASSREIASAIAEDVRAVRDMYWPMLEQKAEEYEAALAAYKETLNESDQDAADPFASEENLFDEEPPTTINDTKKDERSPFDEDGDVW